MGNRRSDYSGGPKKQTIKPQTPSALQPRMYHSARLTSLRTDAKSDSAGSVEETQRWVFGFWTLSNQVTLPVNREGCLMITGSQNPWFNHLPGVQSGFTSEPGSLLLRTGRTPVLPHMASAVWHERGQQGGATA